MLLEKVSLPGGGGVMQLELSQIELLGGTIPQTEKQAVKLRKGFFFYLFTQVNQLCCRGTDGKNVLLFALTLDCCRASSCRKEARGTAEQATWTPAVSVDHLLSPLHLRLFLHEVIHVERESVLQLSALRGEKHERRLYCLLIWTKLSELP